MMNTLYLAWRYLAFNRWKTTILVLSVTLIAFLPVGLNVLVEESATQLTARAATTPLVVGAKGSRGDWFGRRRGVAFPGALRFFLPRPHFISLKLVNHRLLPGVIPF